MTPSGPTWERLEDQLGWYDRKSTAAQHAYKRLKVAQLVVAAAVPVAAAARAPPPAPRARPGGRRARRRRLAHRRPRGRRARLRGAPAARPVPGELDRVPVDLRAA